ncbi:hypothetical protein BVZ80_00042B, partial [Haemophilus influenzae]
HSIECAIVLHKK